MDKERQREDWFTPLSSFGENQKNPKIPWFCPQNRNSRLQGKPTCTTCLDNPQSLPTNSQSISFVILCSYAMNRVRNNSNCSELIPLWRNASRFSPCRSSVSLLYAASVPPAYSLLCGLKLSSSLFTWTTFIATMSSLSVCDVSFKWIVPSNSHSIELLVNLGVFALFESLANASASLHRRTLLGGVITFNDLYMASSGRFCECLSWSDWNEDEITGELLSEPSHAFGSVSHWSYDRYVLTSGIWLTLIACLSECLICKCDWRADLTLNTAKQYGQRLLIICRFCLNWPLRSRAREFWYQTC